MITTLQDTHRYGSFVTVSNPENVASGAILLAILEMDEILECGHSDWDSQSQRNVRTPAVTGRVPAYVFGIPKEDEFKGLNEEVSDLRQQLMRQEAETRLAKDKLKEIESEKQKLSDHIKGQDVRLDQCVSDRAHMRKLENDLAKVRAQFGEKAFNEAVKS